MRSLGDWYRSNSGSADSWPLFGRLAAGWYRHVARRGQVDFEWIGAFDNSNWKMSQKVKKKNPQECTAADDENAEKAADTALKKELEDLDALRVKQAQRMDDGRHLSIVCEFPCQMALRFSFRIVVSVYLQDVLALRPELDASDSARNVGGTRLTDMSYVEKMPLQRFGSQYKATDCSGLDETQCEADVTEAQCSNMVSAVTNKHAPSKSKSQTLGKCYLKDGEKKWEPGAMPPAYQQLCRCRSKWVDYEVADADGACRYFCYSEKRNLTFSEDLARHECDVLSGVWDKYVFASSNVQAFITCVTGQDLRSATDVLRRGLDVALRTSACGALELSGSF
ncbi:unnamed protein product [Symbiodinium microadriaticum]|nr:unnamed protein product [Symbiodinium microadriaticum]